jgi:hypothetical protein
MNEREQRRAFQRVKSMSNAGFWEWMNVIHNRAYKLGQNHLREAMACHPRISAKMIDEVMVKSVEIREQWDGLVEMDVEHTQELTKAPLMGE